MRRKQTPGQQATEPRKPTPTFLLEVPLRVTASQVRRLCAHLDAARQLYNAILEGCAATLAPDADPAWQSARAIPRTQQLERKRAFGELRRQYGISLVLGSHDAVKGLNCTQDS